MDSIKPSLTDMGLCTSINAKSIGDTYDTKKDHRVMEFAEVLDREGPSDSPLKVTGSGFLHQTTYWLNVQNLVKSGFSRGGMTVAINNWEEYFSVRYGKWKTKTFFVKSKMSLY